MSGLTGEQIRDSIQDLDFEPLKITVEKQNQKASEVAGGTNGDVLLNIGWKETSEKFAAGNFAAGDTETNRVGNFPARKIY